jgi:hypothetical protein
MQVKSAPPPPPSAEPGSIVMRFGTAVGIAAVSALVCAVPASMRIARAQPGSEGGVRMWLALASAALGPMIFSVVVLRAARDGLKAFGGPGAGLRAYGAGLWLASILVCLSVLGSVLRATTHHHALAGVTFAFGAVAVAVSSAVVCARIVTILQGSSAAVRTGALVALSVAALAALAWVAVGFLVAVARDPGSSAEAATVVDVLAFAVCALVAARFSLTSRRPIALLGPPIAVVIVYVGVSTLRETSFRDTVREHAPAFASLADFAAPQ